MGGVITVVEGVLAVGFVAQGISEAVLKAKIKAILDEHDQQFKLMNDLYGFVDSLLGQKNLVSQLNSSVLFATDNWNTIFDDLQDKNDLLQKIIQKFPNVNSSNFNYTATQGIIFSVSVLACAYIAYNFISGKAKVSISSDVATFKQFCKTTAEKIRGTAPEIRGSKVNADGSIEVTSHGTSAQNIPVQVRQSNVQTVKAQEKSGWKSKAVTGLRLIFIAVAIYGFVEGVIGLVELSKQLKKYEDYFKAGGQFEQAEDGVLELMNLVAADIFNLANCSRAALYDCKNMFLVKSITLPRYHQKALDYSKKLNPEDFGITQDFIDKSYSLVDSCNLIVKSGKSRKQKLDDLKTYFKSYFDQKKPDQIFLKLSIELSQVVGQYSLVSDSINDDQHNVNRFLKKVADIFDDRGDKFNDKPLQEKKSKDKNFLEKIWDKYKTIFELDDDLKIDKANQATKDIIFQSIISFTDSFYYDDDTGTTLFKKNISEAKSGTNYKTLLTQDTSKANVIPIHEEKQADEAKMIEAWLKIAKDQNEKENFKYWKKDESPTPKFRYIRLQVVKYTNQQGKEQGTLSSFEGISLKLNEQFFNAERDILKNTVTLKEG